MLPDSTEGRDPAAEIAAFLERRVAAGAQVRSGPLVAGLCGAQGIGKSTICRRLVDRLASRGYRTLVVGLDEIYLSRADRRDLARSIHPLLQTRGVPGTHDIELGLMLLQRIRAGQPVSVPVFDKAADDRVPRNQWLNAAPLPDIVLIEGWCIGATAQPPDELVMPVNDLEQDEDPDGIWRRFVNTQLAGRYQRLFAELDLLILLAAPDFDIVATWRGQQEDQLRNDLGPHRGGDHAMDKAELKRFIMHYERLTRHILAEMPRRADFVLQLDNDRRIVEVTEKS